MPTTAKPDPPLLVAAIARKGPDILLVRQYGPHGPDTTWALPGGRCEPGELILDALRRELSEETGLNLDRVLGLAYLAQLDNPTPHRRDPHEIPAPAATPTAIAFEVHVTGDTTNAADPDGFVISAQWVPTAQAARLLSEHPLAFTGLPAAARVRAAPAPRPGLAAASTTRRNRRGPLLVRPAKHGRPHDPHSHRRLSHQRAPPAHRRSSGKTSMRGDQSHKILLSTLDVAKRLLSIPCFTPLDIGGDESVHSGVAQFHPGLRTGGDTAPAGA